MTQGAYWNPDDITLFLILRITASDIYVNVDQIQPQNMNSEIITEPICCTNTVGKSRLMAALHGRQHQFG